VDVQRRRGDTLRRRIGRPWLTGTLLALCLAAVVAAVVVIGPASASEAPQATVTAQRGVVQKTVSADGSLAPGSEAEVNFDAAGTVKRIYVTEGTKVHKGQLLARLDAGDADAQLNQAEAQLNAAEASLTSAQAIEVGSSSSSNSNSGSNQPSSGSQSSGTTKQSKDASVATAQADVQSAQLSVDDAKKAVNDLELRAPMDGVVASLSGSVGQQVTGQASSSSSSSGNGSSSSGSGSNSSNGSSSNGSSSGSDSSSSGSSTAFITIANLNTLTVGVSFSEADITNVKVGQPATITVNALSDKQFAAKVTGIGILSSSSSGVVSYPVTLAMLQMDPGLKPGMTGTAAVIVDQVQGVVTVPSRAISGAGGAQTVTVTSGGKTETRTVTTGLVGDSTTAVLSGLQPGEQVVLPSTASSIAGGAASGGGAQSGGFGGRGAFGGGGAGPAISGGPAGGGAPVLIGPGPG
jgi:multidrug efflux pump subunit AcrA (membrane-fusion protein)